MKVALGFGVVAALLDIGVRLELLLVVPLWRPREALAREDALSRVCDAEFDVDASVVVSDDGSIEWCERQH